MVKIPEKEQEEEENISKTEIKSEKFMRMN